MFFTSVSTEYAMRIWNRERTKNAFALKRRYFISVSQKHIAQSNLFYSENFHDWNYESTLYVCMLVQKKKKAYESKVRYFNVLNLNYVTSVLFVLSSALAEEKWDNDNKIVRLFWCSKFDLHFVRLFWFFFVFIFKSVIV